MKAIGKASVPLVAALVLSAGTARAADPAAIVEAVSPPNPAVAAMDFVAPGATIDIGRNGTLVLGYLKSCTRERIRGGVITVGTVRSSVAGGRVTRETVECDGGRLVLTPEQAARSGALIFRRPPEPQR